MSYAFDYAIRTARPRPQGSLFRRLIRRFQAWRELQRQIDDLRGLPDYLLDDIGVTHAQVDEEVRRQMFRL